MSVTGNEKVRENRLRRQAKRLGLVLRHSRARHVHVDDFGDYMLIDADGNYVVAGSRFELSLTAVQEFLDQYESQLKIAA
jgi:hypothetical protein